MTSKVDYLQSRDYKVSTTTDLVAVEECLVNPATDLVAVVLRLVEDEDYKVIAGKG